MQEPQDIQEKIFFETKNILESLSKISCLDELLEKQDLFNALHDNIAFLRVLNKNKSDFQVIWSSVAYEHIETEIPVENSPNDYVTFNDPLYKEVIEEDAFLNNENNEVEEMPEKLEVLEPTISDTVDETYDEVVEIVNIDVNWEVVNDSSVGDDLKADQETIIEQKEEDFQETAEHRNDVLTTAQDETESTEVFESESEPTDSPRLLAEKRFKLANIKGLKVQSLFQDEEQEIESNPIVEKIDSKSTLKSNVNIDFMEAEKKKTEFRLDLNDKVAFSKILFSGDEAALKSTIDKLNSFSNLEDAKQYLSEVYYAKNWSKVDEYAQRLWNLVENKFM